MKIGTFGESLHLIPACTLDASGVAAGVARGKDLRSLTSGHDCPWSVDHAAAYIAKAQIEAEQGEAFRFGVFLGRGATGRLVGLAELYNVDLDSAVAKVGLQIWSPDDRQRGYGSGALGFLEYFASSQLGIEVARARVFKTNLASFKFLASHGYTEVSSGPALASFALSEGDRVLEKRLPEGLTTRTLVAAAFGTRAPEFVAAIAAEKAGYDVCVAFGVPGPDGSSDDRVVSEKSYLTLPILFGSEAIALGGNCSQDVRAFAAAVRTRAVALGSSDEDVSAMEGRLAALARSLSCGVHPTRTDELIHLAEAIFCQMGSGVRILSEPLYATHIDGRLLSNWTLSVLEKTLPRSEASARFRGRGGFFRASPEGTGRVEEATVFRISGVARIAQAALFGAQVCRPWHLPRPKMRQHLAGTTAVRTEVVDSVPAFMSRRREERSEPLSSGWVETYGEAPTFLWAYSGSTSTVDNVLSSVTRQEADLKLRMSLLCVSLRGMRNFEPGSLRNCGRRLASLYRKHLPKFQPERGSLLEPLESALALWLRIHESWDTSGVASPSTPPTDDLKSEYSRLVQSSITSLRYLDTSPSRAMVLDDLVQPLSASNDARRRMELLIGLLARDLGEVIDRSLVVDCFSIFVLGLFESVPFAKVVSFGQDLYELQKKS